jgi:hypothetical protein
METLRYEASSRIARARTQPLMLMAIHCDRTTRSPVARWHFVVFNRINNHQYSVHFSERRFECECADHQRRHSTCKHMYFIVLNVAGSEALLEKLATRNQWRLESEVALDACLQQRLTRVGRMAAPANTDDATHSSVTQRVHDTHTDHVPLRRARDAPPQRARITRVDIDLTQDDELSTSTSSRTESGVPMRPFPVEEICPIDFEFLRNGQALTHCRWRCGNAMHRDCLAKWLASGTDTCPMCRCKIPKGAML